MGYPSSYQMRIWSFAYIWWMRFTSFSATFHPRAPIAIEPVLPALLGDSHNTEEIPYRVCILLVRPSLPNFSNETRVSSFFCCPQLLPDDGLFLALLPVEVCSVRKAGPPHHLPAGQGEGASKLWAGHNVSSYPVALLTSSSCFTASPTGMEREFSFLAPRQRKGTNVDIKGGRNFKEF